MDQLPDGRILVAEQTGSLRVIKNGSLLPTPFVSLTVDSTGERGLLGVTTDANFATDQLVYVYYTVPGSPAHNRISRFTAGGDVAVAGSEQVLVDLDNLSTATNHNGGGIHFGPDGELYVGVGENGNGANSQTLSNRLGKILRYNPDGSIPTDNPFFTTATGANRAIWALGLRNPYTFAFQPGTGRMFINDVGASSFEEIDDGIAGSNYGWPIAEGFGGAPTFRDPLFAYPHGPGTDAGDAIVGGTFYDPQTAEFPASYVGKYFFSDFVNGWIRVFDPATGTASLFAANVPAGPVDLAVTPDGGLLMLSHGGGAGTGSLTRFDFLTSPPVTVPGSQTVGVFDPGTGTWYLRNQNSAGAPTAGTFSYGGVGWVGLVGDWDGDGVTTIAVVNPATATWYIRNSNTPGAPDITFQYGAPGWIPVAGDWNHTGHAGIGMFDPSTGIWYLRNEVGPGAPDAGQFAYGAPGWIPVVGRWTGGIADGIGVFDPGTGTWYLRSTANGGAPDAGTFSYGGVGWKPVAGDWNGDGVTTVAVLDPAGQWYLRDENSAGAPDITPFGYGLGAWTPVAGIWDASARNAPIVPAPSARHTDWVDQLFAAGLDGM
jgi:glucose/arabinose dehydrogenase